MKHRRVRSARTSGLRRPRPHRIADAIRARREEVIWGAQELGLGDDETDALLRAGLDTAERRGYGDAGKDR